MPIIREFRCGDCGSIFESMLLPEEVDCPKCSAPEPERVFLTAPAIKSPKTSGTDATLKALASDYGLTNMSNRDGAAVRQAPTGDHAPQFATGQPQAMQVLQKLGGHSDGFSGVLPALQRAGRPNQWRKSPERS